MKTKGILKGISFLLLGVILYMHLCSALCATGTSVCCDKEEGDDHHNKKECCSHEKNPGKEKGCEDNDCQNIHFAFFGVTGQFAQAKADILVKSFPPLIAVIAPLFIIQSIETDKSLVDYNSFHPPPPTADIRILIQSFLI